MATLNPYSLFCALLLIFCSFVNFALAPPTGRDGASLAGCPIADPVTSTVRPTIPLPTIPTETGLNTRPTPRGGGGGRVIEIDRGGVVIDVDRQGGSIGVNRIDGVIDVERGGGRVDGTRYGGSTNVNTYEYEINRYNKNTGGTRGRIDVDRGEGGVRGGGGTRVINLGRGVEIEVNRGQGGRIDVERGGGRIDVDRGEGGRGGGTRVIDLGRGVDIEVNRGRIEVERGRIDVDRGQGRVEVDRRGQGVDRRGQSVDRRGQGGGGTRVIELGRGVDIEVNRGRIDVDRGQGRVDIDRGEGGGGRRVIDIDRGVDIEVNRGRIEVDRGRGRIDVNRQRGSVDVDRSGGRINTRVDRIGRVSLLDKCDVVVLSLYFIDLSFCFQSGGNDDQRECYSLDNSFLTLLYMTETLHVEYLGRSIIVILLFQNCKTNDCKSKV